MSRRPGCVPSGAATQRHADWQRPPSSSPTSCGGTCRPGDILTAAEQAGDPADYRCHLLHVEPDGSFSVTAMVWRPGQVTPIHDHVTWCVFGVIQGIEYEELYAICRRRPQSQRRSAAARTTPARSAASPRPATSTGCVTSAPTSPSRCTSTAPTSPGLAAASAAPTICRCSSRLARSVPPAMTVPAGYAGPRGLGQPAGQLLLPVVRLCGRTSWRAPVGANPSRR